VEGQSSTFNFCGHALMHAHYSHAYFVGLILADSQLSTKTTKTGLLDAIW
jgi:hypothetical protein